MAHMRAVLSAAVIATAIPLLVSSASADPPASRDEYVVVLDGKPSETHAARADARADARSLAARYGGLVDRVYSAALRGFSAHLTATQARRLAADPAVRFVRKAGTLHLADLRQEDPPSWGLRQIDNFPNDGHFTYPNRGKGVTVYNIDGGIRTTHVEFEGRASNHDVSDPNPDCPPEIQTPHGTHTAGTSVSQAYGVGKETLVVGVKAFDCTSTASEAEVIAAIDWVTAHDRPAGVVNASWGAGPGENLPAINTAVRGSIDAGLVWVVAAGNDNADACTVSPAKIPRVITVAATARGHKEAGYSNHGDCVDVYAPGTDIISTSSGGDHAPAYMTGTSMATPHVTGGAVLFLHKFPNVLPYRVHDAIVNGARHGFVEDIGPGSANRFLNVQNLPAPW